MKISRWLAKPSLGDFPPNPLRGDEVPPPALQTSSRLLAFAAPAVANAITLISGTQELIDCDECS
ncbi:MAG TPA: hypothetical protein V6C91_16225 [Coleofasciculaceae cyanobacterium]